MPRGNPGESRIPNQLWKMTVSFMLGVDGQDEDLNHAVFFVWACDLDQADEIVDKVFPYPHKSVEAKHIHTHKPLKIRFSVEQQLGIKPIIARKHDQGMDTKKLALSRGRF